jgi:hypothetical protein
MAVGRLPEAEDLWADLASRLEGWNLDDELGPRYERALSRFGDASWWSRAARWYARRSRQAELRRLAEEIAARFRGSELFARAQADVELEIPEQPPVGSRVRLPWADWVRIRWVTADRREQAVGHLLTRSAWEKQRAGRGEAALSGSASIPAVKFPPRRASGPSSRGRSARALPGGRDEGGDAGVRAHGPGQGPTDAGQDLLRSRLAARSSSGPRYADHTAAAYPGTVTSRAAARIHRSLAGLDPARPAREVVTRRLRSRRGALWTELGELSTTRAGRRRRLPTGGASSGDPTTRRRSRAGHAAWATDA